MSLTRRMLKAMGIEDEKIDEIINAHTETVNALKEERDNYKKDAEELPNVIKERDRYKEQAEKDNPYEQKYNDLKKQHDDYVAEQTAKEVKAKKKDAYIELLKGIGVSEKRLSAILKVTDLSSFELDEEGKIKDASKLKDSAKKEWADFIATEGVKGADTSRPPKDTNDDVGKGLSRAAMIAQKHNENVWGVAKGE